MTKLDCVIIPMRQANAEIYIVYLFIICLFDCLLVRLKNQTSLSKSTLAILQVLLNETKKLKNWKFYAGVSWVHSCWRNIVIYYMARQIRVFWLVLPWLGFSPTDRFRGNHHKLRIFLFSLANKFKTSMARVPYNKLLTNPASSSRIGEYWPLVVVVRTSLRSVRTARTLGPIFPSTALVLG